MAPKPRWSLRATAAAVTAILVIGVLAAKLAQLQVTDGTHLAALAQANFARHMVLEADRGIIYDRHGAALVQNSPVWGLAVVPAGLPSDARDRTQELIELARLSGTDEQTLARRLLTAPDLYATTTLKANLSQAEELAAGERLPDLPGTSITQRTVRTYVDPMVFGHVLGYVGPIDSSQLKRLEVAGYQPDEVVGKVGVEAGLESQLRGTDGWADVEVDARGQTVKVLAAQQPVAGDSVYLSIDAGMQRATAASLAAGLVRDNKLAGASVVIDPRTGEVLAMVSLPGYDTNLFTHGISQTDYSRLLNDPEKPLLNRAIAGQYAPGSTFKMVTATAGLQEGKITAQTLLSCPPYINVNGWIYHNWASYSLGWMNVAKALASSCDTFFYQVAAMVGDVKLARYARAFGFGQAKGIEMPGVMPGLVPDRIWKQIACGVPDLNSDACRWSEGDTITFGIGQSYLLTTPLNQAVYVAAVANGGRVLRPTLVHLVSDAGGHVVSKQQTEVTGTVPASADNIEAVREGMREEINRPYNMNYWFRAAGVPADGGGKTGTAQWGGSGLDLPTHAWFVFFAPYAQPELALSVFVERGELSEVEAAPIGVDILKFYRDNVGTIRA
ncbi:MAG TPA: penicillin-binding protein 2 [Candidatus Dormibacteraeota bacterium]